MKFGNTVVKHRRIILIAALVLLIPSVLGVIATRINYDMLYYLPEDIETVQGQNVLLDEFGKGGFSIVVVEDMKSDDVSRMSKRIEEVDHVDSVIDLESILDPSIPRSMLPDIVKIIKDDEDVLSRQDMHYDSGDMEFISGQLGFVFKYDACAEEAAYQKSVLAGKEKHLFERPIKKLIIEKETTGNLKTQGVYVTDGKEKSVGKKVYTTYLSTRTADELLTIGTDSTQWKIPEDDYASI